MPLSLTTEEMDLLLSLAAPIDQRQRTQFLTEVTTAIDGANRHRVRPWRAASHRARCSEEIFFSARIAQLVAALPQRLRAKFKAGTLRARPRLSVVERPGLFASASVGAITSPHESIDGRGRDAVGASSVPASLL
jgi:hypothetical protein